MKFHKQREEELQNTLRKILILGLLFLAASAYVGYGIWSGNISLTSEKSAEEETIDPIETVEVEAPEPEPFTENPLTLLKVTQGSRAPSGAGDGFDPDGDAFYYLLHKVASEEYATVKEKAETVPSTVLFEDPARYCGKPVRVIGNIVSFYDRELERKENKANRARAWRAVIRTPQGHLVMAVVLDKHREYKKAEDGVYPDPVEVNGYFFKLQYIEAASLDYVPYPIVVGHRIEPHERVSFLEAYPHDLAYFAVGVILFFGVGIAIMVLLTRRGEAKFDEAQRSKRKKPDAEALRKLKEEAAAARKEREKEVAEKQKALFEQAQSEEEAAEGDKPEDPEATETSETPETSEAPADGEETSEAETDLTTSSDDLVLPTEGTPETEGPRAESPSSRLKEEGPKSEEESESETETAEDEENGEEQESGS